MKVKLLIIYAVWGVLAVACCGGLGFGGDDDNRYNIINYTIRTYARDAQGNFNLDEIQQVDTVSWFDLGIVLETEKEFISSIRAGSVLNVSYACSPKDPEAVQEISSIEIVSDQAFSTSANVYPAGENLADLFLYEGAALEQSLVGVNHPYRQLLFTLAAEPQSSQSHNFTINITHHTGASYSVETGSLYITP